MKTNMRTDTRTRKMVAGRQAYLLPVWIILLVASLARPAAAQDFQPGDVGINLGMSTLNQERINSVIRLTAEGPKRGSSSSPTRRPVSNFDSRYRAAAAVTQRVIKEYLSFVRSASNEQTMREMQEDLGRFNFVTVWRNIVRSSGLPDGDDMADALSSYLLLNWEMANNRMRDEHDKAAYRAVHDQIRSAMAALPLFAKLSEADRQGFAETMMINFVYQHAAGAHAVRSNDKDMERRLGDAAQQRFLKEFGMNLRDLDLTSNGLVARPGSGAAAKTTGAAALTKSMPPSPRTVATTEWKLIYKPEGLGPGESFTFEIGPHRGASGDFQDWFISETDADAGQLGSAAPLGQVYYKETAMGRLVVRDMEVKSPTGSLFVGYVAREPQQTGGAVRIGRVIGNSKNVFKHYLGEAMRVAIPMLIE